MNERKTAYFKTLNKQELSIIVKDDGFEISITGPLLDYDAPLISYSIKNGIITILDELNKLNDINYCKGIVADAQKKLDELNKMETTSEVRHAIHNQQSIVNSYTSFIKEEA